MGGDPDRTPPASHIGTWTVLRSGRPRSAAGDPHHRAPRRRLRRPADRRGHPGHGRQHRHGPGRGGALCRDQSALHPPVAGSRTEIRCDGSSERDARADSAIAILARARGPRRAPCATFRRSAATSSPSRRARADGRVRRAHVAREIDPPGHHPGVPPRPGPLLERRRRAWWTAEAALDHPLYGRRESAGSAPRSRTRASPTGVRVRGGPRR
jgi:hypothetical protein